MSCKSYDAGSKFDDNANIFHGASHKYKLDEAVIQLDNKVF